MADSENPKFISLVFKCSWLIESKAPIFHPSFRAQVGRSEAAGSLFAFNFVIYFYLHISPTNWNQKISFALLFIFVFLMVELITFLISFSSKNVRY